MEKKRCNTNARDIKRRLDVIRAKMEDLNKLGVPCSFCHLSHWSQGLFVIGDPRITAVIQGHAEEILHRLDSTSDEELQPTKKLHLPPLPGPLYHLNYRTLQSVLVDVARDLGMDWNGDVPEWWPSTVPFCNPRKPPQHPNRKCIMCAIYRPFYERFSNAFVNCYGCDCASLPLLCRSVV